MNREENGRPFFPGHDVDFSISHSGAMAAVSLATEKNIRTGCDIELIRPRPAAEKIAAAFFHPTEREFVNGKFSEGSFGGSRVSLCAEVNTDSINSSNNNCLYDNGSGDQDKNSFRLKRFYSLWVLKECYLKLKGLSVFDMRAAPCFIGTESPGGKGLGRGRVLDKTADGAFSFFLYELSAGSEDYMLAAAVEGSVRSPPEIRRYGFYKTSHCKQFFVTNSQPL